MKIHAESPPVLDLAALAQAEETFFLSINDGSRKKLLSKGQVTSDAEADQLLLAGRQAFHHVLLSNGKVREAFLKRHLNGEYRAMPLTQNEEEEAPSVSLDQDIFSSLIARIALDIDFSSLGLKAPSSFEDGKNAFFETARQLAKQSVIDFIRLHKLPSGLEDIVLNGENGVVSPELEGQVEEIKSALFLAREWAAKFWDRNPDFQASFQSKFTMWREREHKYEHKDSFKEQAERLADLFIDSEQSEVFSTLGILESLTSYTDVKRAMHFLEGQVRELREQAGEQGYVQDFKRNIQVLSLIHSDAELEAIRTKYAHRLEEVNDDSYREYKMRELIQVFTEEMTHLEEMRADGSLDFLREPTYAEKSRETLLQIAKIVTTFSHDPDMYAHERKSFIEMALEARRREVFGLQVSEFTDRSRGTPSLPDSLLAFEEQRLNALFDAAFLRYGGLTTKKKPV